VPVELVLGADAVEVRLTGPAVALAFARTVRVSRSSVLDARVEQRRSALNRLGWRRLGTYLPGAVAAGWFAVPGRPGHRQFAFVRRGSRVLVVDTDDARCWRLVLEVADPDAVAEALTDPSR
jgi:hypothetical protein